MATRAAKRQRSAVEELQVSFIEFQTKIDELTKTVKDILASQTKAQKAWDLIEEESKENARRFKAIEAHLAKLEGQATHSGKIIEQGNIREWLPENIAPYDLPKFKGVEDPLAHINAFREQMFINRIKKEQWPTLFPLSLEDAPRTWFYSMSPEKMNTFERIIFEFGLQYYKRNPQASKKASRPLSQRDTEILSEHHYQLNQASNSSEGQDTLSAPVKPLVLKRKVRDIAPIPMTYTEAFQILNEQNKLQPIGPTEDPVIKPHWWNANKYCIYHEGRGHDTEKCFRLKHKIQDMIDAGEIPKP